MEIAIVGAGNVGKVLGTALAKKGYHLKAASAKTENTRRKVSTLWECPVFSEPYKAAVQGDIVFLTTPDQVIEEVCIEIARRDGFRKGQVVLHTSGAHSSAVLSAAKEAGADIMSFHPLQTFPQLEVGLRSLPGTFFAVDGDEKALLLAKQLVEALEGELLSIPTALKPLYHAAACTACNYLVSLMDMALRMYGPLEIAPSKAMEALTPLIEGTLENIRTLNPEQALTGPIARGDLNTIESHMENLKEHKPELLPYYCSMGIYTAELAVRKGTINKEKEKVIKTMLGG